MRRTAADRRCPEDPSLSVGEAFAQEAAHLLALPDNPYPTNEQVAVKVGKTPYVRFDLNGAHLGAITTALVRLLDRYGATELRAGVVDARQRQVPHPHAVRLALERRREARDLPPPVEIALPAQLQSRDTPVPPHSLDGYDQLTGGGGNDAD